MVKSISALYPQKGWEIIEQRARVKYNPWTISVKVSPPKKPNHTTQYNGNTIEVVLQVTSCTNAEDVCLNIFNMIIQQTMKDVKTI